jgi:hypothetical protein
VTDLSGMTLAVFKTMANLRLSTMMRALCVALTVAACAGPARGQSAVKAAPAGTAARMSDHFEDSIEIKDAIIAGDLQGVRSPARSLSERPGEYPAAWIPFVADNVELALAALTATNLAEAAQAAAGLANTCGECHTALGRGPRFSASRPPRPAASHDTRRHMDRHQWAADRMWESLVEHDEGGWFAGARALSDAPMLRRDIPAKDGLPDAVLGLDDHISELGRQALTTSTWDARTRLYGDFLASCAGCHTHVL